MGIAAALPENKFPQLRFFLVTFAIAASPAPLKASSRWFTLLRLASSGCGIQPRFIKTNVLGAENVVQALDTSVKRVVALSTDKAAAQSTSMERPSADKLFIAANNVKGTRDLRFSVVRYGNVMGSRGSVIPFFLEDENGRF